MESAKWQLLPAAPEEYLSASGVPALIAQLLYNRGVKPGEIDLFLASNHRLVRSPFLLPDMSQAVNRIYKALLSGEKIAVYGDFDVDGITAAIVVVEGLSWLGSKAIPYMPDRHEEGHGLNSGAIEKLHSQGVNLIITVDCGVTDCDVVEKSQQMGMDVVITDHHIPPQELPRAVAVVDPKRVDSRYPFSDFAGVGVAFKLMQALLYGHNKEGCLNEFLDLVALGTVTDLVPLVGENRCLVEEGIKILNDTHRIGLKEMIALSGLRLGHIDTEDISYALGPRLNAASRIANACISYELLVTQSSEEAGRLARELDEKNVERQRLTSEVQKRVRERLLLHRAYRPLLMEGDESYPLGVIGLVAGRLVEEFYKPAIILNFDSERCRGSCRSIREFDMVAALEKCRDLLDSFGGHPMAAGFTVARENLAELEQRLTKLATDELGHLELMPKLVIDAEVPLSVVGDAFNLIQKIAPFGRGNPAPTFLARRLEVIEHRNLGNEGQHLQCKIRQGNTIWRAMAFNAGKPQEVIPAYIDAVYKIERHWWNGEEVLRLNLLDFMASQA